MDADRVLVQAAQAGDADAIDTWTSCWVSRIADEGNVGRKIEFTAWQAKVWMSPQEAAQLRVVVFVLEMCRFSAPVSVKFDTPTAAGASQI